MFCVHPLLLSLWPVGSIQWRLFFLLDSVKALVCWHLDPVVILLIRGEYRIFFFLFVRLTSEQLEANFVVDLWLNLSHLAYLLVI